jgi:3-methyladenine DNA glycosylase AlkC
MPEPFKNLFNPRMIAQMGGHLRRVQPAFDERRFRAVATRDIQALELKQRSAQIVAALEACLPESFPAACDMLLAALHPQTDADLSDVSMDEQGIRGWAVMPMADYVAVYGMPHFDLSMRVLKELTKRSSAEFAIRAFLLADTGKALGYLHDWADDANYHVRRLVSEGARPRLPWGVRLPMFVDDPAPLLPLLEKLRDDPENYVRRSVANNLNDIAKDHPDTVARVARTWLRNASLERERLVRHACRTLLKQGHPQTLAVFGYGKPQVTVRFALDNQRVKLGGKVCLQLRIGSRSKQRQTLLLDYIVQHRRANDTLSPKVFKWKTLEIPAQDFVVLEKSHSLKPVTTRKYYAGTHRIDIQINGQVCASAEFDLLA